MTTRRLICAVAILCCASAAALADGTVFVQGIAKPRIPDQSALITFDGKTERLVIETAVEGEGTEFAWVVPVPSLPKVEAATPGLFPTLRAITRARVVGFASHWPLLPVTAVLFGILIWWAIARGRWLAPLVICLILLILEGIILAGPTRISGVMSGGVTILDRKMVGLYETVTISGADGKNIADWLNSNGFKVPSNKQDALAQYSREGWMFVAGRIRRDSSEVGRFSAHPLSFTFATSRAVYPMRLTGIENGAMAVDLYAVGNEEAAAAPFVRRRAGRLDFHPKEERDDFIPVSHDALRSYCKGFSSLTVLSATLSPEEMKDDLYLTWKPLSPFRRVYFMREAAQEWAWHAAAGTFLLISIVCAVEDRRRYYQGGPAAWTRSLATLGILLGSLGLVAGIFLSFFIAPFRGVIIMSCSLAMLAVAWCRANDYDRQTRELQQSAEPTPSTWPSSRDEGFLVLVTVVVFAPILLGYCVYLVLPKAPEAQVLKVRMASSIILNVDHAAILKKLGEMNVGGDPASALAAYRKEAASIIAGWQKEYPKSEYGKNYLSGLPYVEEDSPGNYVIELKAGKPTYFYFDRDGRKIGLRVIGEEVRSKSDE